MTTNTIALVKSGVALAAILAIFVLAALHDVTGSEAVGFATVVISVYLGGLSVVSAAMAIANRPGVPPLVGQMLTTVAKDLEPMVEAITTTTTTTATNATAAAPGASSTVVKVAEPDGA